MLFSQILICSFVFSKIESIEFCRNEQNEKGEWVEDHDQITKLKANFVISAFGSVLSEKDGNFFYYEN